MRTAGPQGGGGPQGKHGIRIKSKEICGILTGWITSGATRPHNHTRSPPPHTEIFTHTHTHTASLATPRDPSQSRYYKHKQTNTMTITATYSHKRCRTERARVTMQQRTNPNYVHLKNKAHATIVLIIPRVGRGVPTPPTWAASSTSAKTAAPLQFPINHPRRRHTRMDYVTR